MTIGVDFDNTIVCYDGIFHRVAVEWGLIPATSEASKTAVRDHLRQIGNEVAWTELQGYVYGPRLVEAEIFPGVKDFFDICRERDVTVKIISHKTRHPYVGEKYDLHAAALRWLEHHQILGANAAGLAREAVFFELTKQDKLARIESERCDVFIDDLPELFAEPAFPPATRQVLFDPLSALSDDPACCRIPDRWKRARSWAEIEDMLFYIST